MTSEDLLSQRRLEERVTHCEQLADALNGVVADLQKRVLALETLNRKLLSELREQQEALRSFGPAGERPPHY